MLVRDELSGDQGARVTHHHAVDRFGRDASEIRRARHFVRSSLTAWGLGAHAPALELAVSELVTNALVHGDGAIEVAVEAGGGQVRLEVGDEGGDLPGPSVRAGAGPEAPPGGWGLRIVGQLADRWGTDRVAEGTRVWMVRETP